MVDFNNLRSHTRECVECGAGFRTFREDEDLCTEHSYYRDHPEAAPKYWTWTKGGDEWYIRAVWPDRELEPEVGIEVTVHRQDGSVSDKIIREVLYTRYNNAGDKLVYCRI